MRWRKPALGALTLFILAGLMLRFDFGPASPDGTPVFLIMGQSNAEIMYNYSSIQDTLEELGSDAMVVKVANGGQSLARPNGEWNIVTGDGSDTPGSSYTELMQTVAQIKADTPDAYIAGALWLQGEADAVSDNVIGGYYDPLTTLFTEMRSDIGNDFPITIVGLSDYQHLHVEAREHIQSVQEQAALDLDNVYFIDTDQIIADNGLSQADVMRDGLHYTVDFFDRLANETLKEPAHLDALGFTTGSGSDGGDASHDNHNDTGGDTGGDDTGGHDDGDDHGGNGGGSGGGDPGGQRPKDH